jgi:hypothetical protein
MEKGALRKGQAVGFLSRCIRHAHPPTTVCNMYVPLGTLTYLLASPVSRHIVLRFKGVYHILYTPHPTVIWHPNFAWRAT